MNLARSWVRLHRLLEGFRTLNGWGASRVRVCGEGTTSRTRVQCSTSKTSYGVINGDMVPAALGNPIARGIR